DISQQRQLLGVCEGYVLQPNARVERGACRRRVGLSLFLFVYNIVKFLKAIFINSHLLDGDGDPAYGRNNAEARRRVDAQQDQRVLRIVLRAQYINDQSGNTGSCDDFSYTWRSGMSRMIKSKRPTVFFTELSECVTEEGLFLEGFDVGETFSNHERPPEQVRPRRPDGPADSSQVNAP